jgi:hypothetical protein
VANVFIAAGAKARHSEVTIYHDLCTVAEPFASCGKRIVPGMVKVPAAVNRKQIEFHLSTLQTEEWTEFHLSTQVSGVRKS